MRAMNRHGIDLIHVSHRSNCAPFCCMIQASLLSKLSIESSSLPSLVTSLKSFQVAAEAGNFIVQEN